VSGVVDDWPRSTWDGQPVAAEPPFGASVVAFRVDGGERRYLVLHHSIEGPDYDGDWAWGPPAGARLPGESPEACARRELTEEAGAESLTISPTDLGSVDWFVYLVAWPDALEVVLSDEHDRFEWLAFEEAMIRCRPAIVADVFGAVEQMLEGET
jgi:8-oxo-dGTP pyrophosphatase MutT (NUDIX family)